MTEDQAKTIVDLIADLAKDIAFSAVCEHEGDYDTRGDESYIKRQLIAALRDLGPAMESRK